MTGEERDEFWLEQFAKCIKCGGCWKACPVCTCDDCKLESCEPRWVEEGLPPSPKLQYTTGGTHGCRLRGLWSV